MASSVDHAGLKRRQLLAGLGVASAAGLAAAVRAQPGAQPGAWDMTTDVLVVGSGAAGASAAIEASQAGAAVLLIESLPRFGGSSAMSAGVVYAGGGTALQRALGGRDSVEAMSAFIAGMSGPQLPLEKIQLYCEQSPAHFDWLVEQGVRYGEKLATAMSVPLDGESLYFSGAERA